MTFFCFVPLLKVWDRLRYCEKNYKSNKRCSRKYKYLENEGRHVVLS